MNVFACTHLHTLAHTGLFAKPYLAELAKCRFYSARSSCPRVVRIRLAPVRERLADFAPDARRRKQRQMADVRGGDHGFVAGMEETPFLRGEDHVGVQ